MGRREEKREATRQEILLAARELFSSKGYDGTSVDDIVLAANLAKGTFYYHFDSKEALLSALQKSILQRAGVEVQRQLAAGESPLKVLFWMVAETGHWTEANPEFARSMFAQKAAQMMHDVPRDKCPTDHHHHGGLMAVLRDLLQRAQQANEIRQDVEVAEVIRVIMPTIMAARTMWLFNPEGSLVHRLERTMQLLLEGIAPRR